MLDGTSVGCVARVKLVPLLAVLAVAACGGGDGDGDAGAGTAGATATSARTEPAASGEPLRFEQVEDFTVEHFAGLPKGDAGCGKPAWIRGDDRKQQAGLAFPKTKRTEALTCDGVASVVYLEYEDAAAATQGLGSAAIGYLLAGETTVVMPLVTVDAKVASTYLDALKAERGCGEVVKPGP